MKTVYRALDGKEFEDKEKCLKHEAGLLKMKELFDILVGADFFQNYKIPTFYHNHDVSNLGKPSCSDWKYSIHGYVRVYGRMGNGNTCITFKLRKRHLLIFRFDTDDDRKSDKRYLCKIDVDYILAKVEGDKFGI